ncbi:hypothetical protein A2382_03660 [Candidatus Woesebacteria bacterium RIFOXYB1_FULL_38_16]|uniref:Uncharacterized protein n=1 Tax=Candidatus Woesebacteria bacterium RIFOXYB1_FULL_38_16 TaxID=1802538 RepID=A0A1F8CRR7_9BACT|nr:MAG: hypothetical protein A2191_02040 [Candidatus Woesebacteria bacterium RIFOXYA1_FULL_38_9]OGM78982.1 MAG: hypothetical protein A2382_03660 [Candidatus Woesebacteria bacterium RIFOXYB1_FULL_38_16]
MKKAALLLVLYFYALGKYLLRQTTHTKPKGEEGKAIFLFCDHKTSRKLHGVVAFVLPQEQILVNINKIYMAHLVIPVK